MTRMVVRLMNIEKKQVTWESSSNFSKRKFDDVIILVNIDRISLM